MSFRNQIEKNLKDQKHIDYDVKEPSLFKQSAYFHHEKKMDPQELRYQALEDKILQIEEMNNRKFEHLEERIRQVNQKFDRIEQLGERLESLNKLIDTLKSNFDAKLMVFEDKYQQQNAKIDKRIVSAIDRFKTDNSEQSRRTKNESMDDEELVHMVKKSIQIQKELQYDISVLKQNLSSKDVRQSEVLLNRKGIDLNSNQLQQQILNNNNGTLKQSNVISQNTVQSPSNHQRLDSFKLQQQQRVRSITLEKQYELEQQKQKSRNEISNIQLNTEEDEERKGKSRQKKEDLNVNMNYNNTNNIVDKYQFTLQSKNPQQQENQDLLQCSKSQQCQLKQSLVNIPVEQRDRTQSKGTIQVKRGFESGKVPQPTEQGKSLLERTVSQDNFARSKYLASERISGQFKASEINDSQPMLVREQLKNMRK